MDFYTLSRIQDARERARKKKETPDIYPDIIEKPSRVSTKSSTHPPLPKKLGTKRGVDDAKTIMKICPICLSDFRVTPCGDRHKTCRKPECVREYKSRKRRPQIIKKCEAPGCYNYLDSSRRQIAFCGVLCKRRCR